MKRTYATRPSQFERLIRNFFTSSESTFVTPEQWAACVDANLTPLLAKTDMQVWAGLDLGLRHDSTALVALGWDGDRVRLVDHKIFVPKAGETLDIESTAEAAVMSLCSRFALVECRFDPWQGIALAQRLVRTGVNMVEWPQSSGNLSLMGGNLLELITRRQIVAYPDNALRQAISKTVAIENSRGWRLGKTKEADRVDLAIALAMAAIAITQAGKPCGVDHAFQARAIETFRAQTAQRQSHRSFDGVADEGSRLYGTAAANNAREERAELMARSSPRWRWRGL
jgi:phage terminase large subunit-like protein